MFTRHLYQHDEVISALHWCLRTGRAKEALFWCTELLDSEMEETIHKELFLGWLWLFGIGRLSILPSLSNLVTKEDILQLVYNMARLPNEARDRSVLVLLLLGSSDEKQPDRASGFSCLQPLFDSIQCSPLEKAFASAVYQGKSRLAFDLSRPLWQTNPRRVYDLLDRIQEIKHKGTLSEHLTLLEFHETTLVWPIRACAVACVCLDKKRIHRSLKPLDCTLPSDVQTSLSEWNTLLGRRKRRMYSIPQECIYYKTKRGCISNKESTLKELYEVSHETLEGCPFWTRVIEEEVPWLDDDRKEEFYDLYFPDDIPDEWSRQDQEKSHGWGSLINAEVPNYAKYIDRWMRNLPTNAYWCTNRDLSKLCKQDEPDWDHVFTRPWSEIVSSWCLTPVKKRILILNEEA